MEELSPAFISQPSCTMWLFRGCLRTVKGLICFSHNHLKGTVDMVELIIQKKRHNSCSLWLNGQTAAPLQCPSVASNRHMSSAISTFVEFEASYLIVRCSLLPVRDHAASAAILSVSSHIAETRIPGSVVERQTCSSALVPSEQQ